MYERGDGYWRVGWDGCVDDIWVRGCEVKVYRNESRVVSVSVWCDCMGEMIKV